MPLSLAVIHPVILDLPFITTKVADDSAIRLSHLHITVQVVGHLATTTLDMQFYNPMDVIREGELQFPLSQGITISRFALDVNGEMREGVVVEKEKATQAFEAIVRRNVDPGLVEVTRGNNFKARVYPIPEKGYKRAILAFEHELTTHGKEWAYHLPITLNQPLEQFEVQVQVSGAGEVSPVGLKDGIELSFAQAEDGHEARYSGTYLKPVAFSVSQPQPYEEVLAHRGPVTDAFCFSLSVPVTPETRPREKPNSIAIVWDCSASGATRATAKEVAAIEKLLEWMGKGHVWLHTFSNAFLEDRYFELRDGRCEDLISHLGQISYDGGTNLGAVEFDGLNLDYIFLFSDGLSNFEIDEVKTGGPAILLTINTAASADHHRLARLAQPTGGEYINATRMDETALVSRLLHQPKQLIGARFEEGQVDAFYPNRVVKAEGVFSAAGQLIAEESTVALDFGFGVEVTETITVPLRRASSTGNALPERSWAQRKLDHLLGTTDREAVKAHGKLHSLVTPGTSLIVLEDVEDYVKYEITPPRSLRLEYARLQAEKRQSAKELQAERMEILVRQFEGDQQWWETSNQLRSEQDLEEYDEELERGVGAVGSAVAAGGMEEEYFAEEESYSEMGGSPGLRSRAGSPGGFSNEGEGGRGSIEIAPWDSSAPYLKALDSVELQHAYVAYLELKKTFGQQPPFYFDVATWFLRKGLRDEGLRILSNLAELELENTELLRSLGFKLSEFEFHSEALVVFQEVFRQRPFEPHSHLHLAQTHVAVGNHQEAVAHFYAVVMGERDEDLAFRFEGIELIALHDLNRLIFHHGEGLDLSDIDPRFLRNLPVDIRVLLEWDANDTDIDLWVTDPNQVKCSYGNPHTPIGGRLSNDITQGYGPEEFRLKKAPAGEYLVEADFFGSHKQMAAGNVTVRAVAWIHFGTPREQQEVVTVQLAPGDKGGKAVMKLTFSGKD